MKQVHERRTHSQDSNPERFGYDIVALAVLIGFVSFLLNFLERAVSSSIHLLGVCVRRASGSLAGEFPRLFQPKYGSVLFLGASLALLALSAGFFFAFDLKRLGTLRARPQSACSLSSFGEPWRQLSRGTSTPHMKRNEISQAECPLRIVLFAALYSQARRMNRRRNSGILIQKAHQMFSRPAKCPGNRIHNLGLLTWLRQ